MNSISQSFLILNSNSYISIMDELHVSYVANNEMDFNKTFKNIQSHYRKRKLY